MGNRGVCGGHDGDLAGRIAAQVAKILGHLPEGLLSEDEPVHVGLTGDGTLVIRVDATGDQYSMFKGHAARCRQLSPENGEVTLWRDRKLVELMPVDLTAGEAAMWRSAPRAG